MLKDRNILSEKYIIESDYIKRWFRKNKIVYNLYKIEKGKKWSDSSYGNGGGDFIEFEDRIKLACFKSFGTAMDIKRQLEKNENI